VRLRLIASLFLLASPLAAQVSLPAKKPIACSGPASNCLFLASNGYTSFIVARLAGQPITVTIGYGNVQTVKPDYVNTFTGDSIYHLAFTSLPYSSGVVVSFGKGAGLDVFILLYEGVWAYSKGAQGDYSNANDVFTDCTDGQNCPYWWTRPVVPQKGDLLISFANSNAVGCGLFRPGPGWTIEATSCIFAVEDKIATVEAPDIGSMYFSLADGSDSGGSHWLMALADYRRVQ
jgi:hypothetical protein